ncbi:hypothetical protein BsWGS_12130 [Bradybaena similaris]
MSVANSTIGEPSETSINTSNVTETSMSTVHSTTVTSSKTSINNSITAAISETTSAKPTASTTAGTSVANTNITTTTETSLDYRSVTSSSTTSSQPPVQNNTAAPITTVGSHSSTSVTETTSKSGLFPSTDELHSTNPIPAEQTTVSTDASSTPAPPRSPSSTASSAHTSNATVPAIRPSSTDSFQSERLLLNGKVNDLNHQVLSLTIALAVVSAVLGTIILIFIIYRLFIYARGKGRSATPVIDDLDGKPEKKRQQVSYFRPQSNYYDIGDKDDNLNAAFSNETTPGKGDSLVTFNRTGIPLTAAGDHSNSLQANESQDTDSNFSTTGSRKGGKLGEAPNEKQTVDHNHVRDTSFVEINLT